MRNYLTLFLLGLSFSLFAQTNIIYQASTSDFPNPERGFYRYSAAYSTGYSVLDAATLANYRLLHSPPTAAYSIYSSLVYRYFFLEDFKTSPIPQWYLDNMQADFDAVRSAGVKIIPRFAYTESFSSPPYGDASKTWVLTHIAQLEEVLKANKDIIAAVQMGFIGVWGENYYTDFFGDASQPPGKILDANWADRNEVLGALLDIVPEERMVQVRYPQLKQRYIYGISAPTSSAAMTLAEAFTNTDKARLGFHNDCLLADQTDYGTYSDYGNSSAPYVWDDTGNLKPYFTQDGKFTVVGGETCDDGYNPESNCASTHGSALGDTELEDLHYSYLNSQYNNAVNNNWHSGGCMEEIKRRLGYRLELQDGTYSNAAQPNQIISVDIDLQNIGYASPFNKRGLELVLRHTGTLDTWFAVLPDDPRYWFAENTTYNILHDLCIPSTMPMGTYELLLNLPDPMPLISDRPEYAIRLANLLPDISDVWEDATGYNRLGHTIIINSSASNPACSGEITFSPTSSLSQVAVIQARVFLQGPHNGTDMNNDLQTANLIPLNDPYGLGESVTTIPDNIVDWVKVELRDPTDNTNVVATRALFVRTDGQIVELDGTPHLAFPAVNLGTAYVAVHHRNHLGTMTTAPVVLN